MDIKGNNTTFRKFKAKYAKIAGMLKIFDMFLEYGSQPTQIHAS